MMIADRSLRRLIPTGFSDLEALPLRPGQAHYINDYVRQNGLEPPEGSSNVRVTLEEPEPQFLIKTILRFGETTNEGTIVEAVTLPWAEIIERLLKDPKAALGYSPREWEQIIAGVYKASGFDVVILTPASGDFGRDIIATKKGVGEVRVIDQVKAYKPGHFVTANDVRALAGVLQREPASKGFLTTTSDFAPMIRTDPFIAPLVPQRLQLINWEGLVARLVELQKRLKQGTSN
jgi:restriction system protein